MKYGSSGEIWSLLYMFTCQPCIVQSCTYDLHMYSFLPATKELHGYVEQGLKVNMIGRCTSQLVRAVERLQEHMAGKDITMVTVMWPVWRSRSTLSTIIAIVTVMWPVWRSRSTLSTIIAIETVMWLPEVMEHAHYHNHLNYIQIWASFEALFPQIIRNL